MPTFAQVISDPFIQRRFLATLYPKDSTGATQTKYVSDNGRTNSGSESPAHIHYEGRIKQAIDFERFMFERNRVEGRSIPSYGALVLSNADHEIDDWDDLIFDEQRVVIELGAENSTRAEYGIVFDGTAVRAWVAEEVRIQLRDLQYKLDKPVARTVYRGMGSALLFNGTGNYADTNATTVTPAAAETFEGWFRDFKLGGTIPFLFMHGSADNASNTNVKITRTTLGALSATIARNSGSQVTISYAPIDTRNGPWVHVALVVAAGTNACKFYVNGELAGSATAPALTATAKVFTWGAVAGGASNRLGGMADDFRYWTVARTQDEIRSSMNRELEGNETGLVHYWRCNEGTGATAANKVTGATLAITLQAGAGWGSSTEGSADVAGGKKQRAYGHPPNVKGRLVDAQKLIYQFSEGYTSRIKAVYDKGVALTAGTAYSRLYDFLTNTPAAGSYSTYLAEGLIRCGMQPVGDPTADLIGEAPGRWGVQLDGVNDEVTATLAPPAGSMTMEGWFYFNSGSGLGTRRFAGWRNAATAGARCLVLPQSDPSILRFQTVNDAGGTVQIDSTAQIKYDRWVHIAAVVDVTGAQLRLYVNGNSAAAPVALSGTYNTVTLTDLRIGRSQDLATYVPMSADDFRLWSVARTEAQIRETMFTRMVGTETGLYSCHQFDDATGTSAVDQVAAKPAMTLTGGVVWGGGYAPDTGALLSRWIAGERAGIVDFSGMNLSSIYSVESTNGAAMQFLVTGNETCLDALDLLANSMGTYYGFDRAGLFDMGSVELPKGSAVKDLTEEVIKSIKPLEVPNPVWRQVVNYNRVWTVQGRDQLAGGVSSSRAEFVAKGWRQAEQSSESIRQLYGDKEPLTIDTALVFKADADALALLRLTRYGTKRKMYEVELKADGWDLDVAEVVGITFPDYGFAGGVNCRIIGMSENAATGYVRLYVWR